MKTLFGTVLSNLCRQFCAFFGKFYANPSSKTALISTGHTKEVRSPRVVVIYTSSR